MYALRTKPVTSLQYVASNSAASAAFQDASMVTGIFAVYHSFRLARHAELAISYICDIILQNRAL